MAHFNNDEVNFIIQDLQKEFWGYSDTGQSGHRDALRQMVIKRRQHFHNLGLVAPVLEGPLAMMPTFQSDIPRHSHQQLKARITENHFVTRVIPMNDTSTERVPANKVERILNQGLRIVEERLGYQLQDAMSDGQIIDGVCFLHWRKLDEIIPDYPDADERDEKPTEAQASRYSKRRVKGKYVETAESVEERHKQNYVKAGFPWHAEVIPATDILWKEDDLGLSKVCVIKTVRLMQYIRDNDTAEGSPAISFNDVDRTVHIYQNRGEAPDQLTGKPGFGDRIMVAQFWTRDEFYELVSTDVFSDGPIFVGGWEIVKSGPHPYSGVPFAKVPAIISNTASPELQYEPMLEGVFRLKPLYDRGVSLMLGILEQDANPYYYLRQIGGTEPLLDDKGDIMYMTRDAEMAKKVPSGYELVKVDFSVGEGEVEAVKFLREEIQAAMPATGRAEYSASTQPWTMRLSLQQENVEPKRLMQLQQAALQKMARDMMHVMSLPGDEGGFGEPVYVFCKYTEGEVEMRSIEGVEPDDIRSLDVEIDIVSTSQAERITLVEHGRALLADPLVPLSTPKFLEEYMGEQDPDRIYVNWKAREAFEQLVMPGLLKQELAAWMGNRFVMGPGGEFVGPDGQPAAPEQVMEANGQTPEPPPSQAPMQPPGAMQGNVAPPGQPPLPSMTVPGTVPMQGLRG